MRLDPPPLTPQKKERKKNSTTWSNVFLEDYFHLLFRTLSNIYVVVKNPFFSQKTASSLLFERILKTSSVIVFNKEPKIDET